MTREEKIQLLEKIHAGELSLGALQGPQFYLFVEHSDRPGVYVCEGKEYSPTQYEEFKKSLRSIDIAWLEQRTYNEVDH